MGGKRVQALEKQFFINQHISMTNPCIVLFTVKLCFWKSVKYIIYFMVINYKVNYEY